MLRKTWQQALADRRGLSSVEYALMGTVGGAFVLSTYRTLAAWLETVIARLGT
jgi:Flp pilus assembly pilin Flp